MAAKSKKSLSKRGRDKQSAEITRLQHRIAAGKLIDVGTKGKLLIDDFVDDYGKGQKRFLRSEIERLARKAAVRTAHLVEGLPKRRQIAERALHALTEIDQASRWLRTVNAADLGEAFAAKPGASGSAARAWSQIVNCLIHVHDWHEVVLEHFDPSARAPSGQVLAKMFVLEMGEFHERQTGNAAPKARSGRFVEIMQAAWADLKFPELPEYTLGSLAERLPHSKPKLAKRTRQ